MTTDNVPVNIKKYSVRRLMINQVFLLIIYAGAVISYNILH